MGEFVSVTVTDRVATIRLDRPPMNAISMQVQDELRQAVADIGAEPGIRAAEPLWSAPCSCCQGLFR